MAYEVNYDDERFKEVESDKNAAISETEKLYSGMIDESDQYYQAQIDASKEWEKKQTELQQEQTDFAIEKIEQQKEQSRKDYLKEQSGAYKDWQKQSNQYGVNAEQKAAMGMTNTGYSESSQVSMYNTYQNRVATARESYNNAVLNYNNAIKDARLQNNAALAEIAYQSLQKQLELSLQGFQYKNQLLLDKVTHKQKLDSEYYGRYQDVLNQINTENALSEEIRQFNESMALEREQWEWTKAQSAKRSSGGGGGSSRSSPSSSGGQSKIKQSSGKGYSNPKGKIQPKAASDSSVGSYSPSQGVQNKIKSLEMTSGMGGGKEAIGNSIVVYEQTGAISGQDADYMMRHFGLNPKDYYDD